MTERSLALCLILSASCSLESSPPATRGPMAVGPNVLVSADMPKWQHTEYMADAHPSDPKRLMLCSMFSSQDENQLSSGVYVSGDGGATWKLTKNDSSMRFGGVWDPACAFGPRGDAWFMTITNDVTRPYPSDGPEEGSYEAFKTPEKNRGRVGVYHSTDAGATWTKTQALAFLDNEDITIDRTGGKFGGRIYVYGNTFPWTSVWLVYSADEGRTFVQSKETKLKSGEAVHAGPGATLADGTLLLPYEVYADRQAQTLGRSNVAVAASTDGGDTLGQPVTVAPRFACRRMRDPGTADRESSAGPSTTNIAVDRSPGPYANRTYVEWVSMDRDQCTVFVSYSDDGGKKWAPPIRVSDAPLKHDHGPDVFLPQIAVNKDGVVAATWYDRREARNAKDHRLRMSVSLDGGDTWAPSVAVSQKPFVYRGPAEWSATATATGGGRRTRPEEQRTDTYDIRVFPGARLHEAWNGGMGDYAAIAAGADGRFHAFWIDNRSGVAQLYTAAITVDGKPAPMGSTELAGLENVTKLVELQYTKAAFDPAARTLDLEFQMLNSSEKATIVAPLKMRFLGMTSDVGAPTVVSPKGLLDGVLDLSSTIPAGGLAPGQTSSVSRVTLRFAPGDVVINPRGNTDIARIQARLFGKRK
jgi:hypothetical protein